VSIVLPWDKDQLEPVSANFIKAGTDPVVTIIALLGNFGVEVSARFAKLQTLGPIGTVSSIAVKVNAILTRFGMGLIVLNAAVVARLGMEASAKYAPQKTGKTELVSLAQSTIFMMAQTVTTVQHLKIGLIHSAALTTVLLARPQISVLHAAQDTGSQILKNAQTCKHMGSHASTDSSSTLSLM
jgi:hypothetical protein